MFDLIALDCIYTYLGCLKDDSESTESIIKKFFINLWVKVTNEDICANVLPFCVC